MPKINILQNGSYFSVYQIILMTILGILLSTSSSAKSRQRNVCFSCNIYYETSSKGKAEFSLNVSKENMSNWSCQNQNTKTCEVYETLNISSVQYSENISFHEQFLATKTPRPIVCNQNHFSCNLGQLRDLKCNCISFDFNQTVVVTYTQLGKADVTISGFYEIPKLKDTNVIVIPNKYSEIKKVNTKHFEISVSDLCKIYNLTIKVESQPKCTNWKIQPKPVRFPISSGNVNISSCQYNQTITTLTTSADNESLVYFNLSFENESFIKNVTRELTLPTKWLKRKSEKNVTGSIQICAHGCNRCEIVKNFTCYSTISKSLKIEEISSNITLILCVVAGLIFFGMRWIVLWFKLAKGTKNRNSDTDEIRPRVILESLPGISVQTIENNTEGNDPTYEVIKDFHHYDKPDINFTDVFFLKNEIQQD